MKCDHLVEASPFVSLAISSSEITHRYTILEQAVGSYAANFVSIPQKTGLWSEIVSTLMAVEKVCNNLLSLMMELSINVEELLMILDGISTNGKKNLWGVGEWMK